MSYTYTRQLDKEMDARNRYDGLTTTYSGYDRKERGRKYNFPAYDTLIANIAGRSKQEANKEILAYLDTIHRVYSVDIEKALHAVKTVFDPVFQQACHALERITAHPLYRTDFSIYATTFPRGPYEYEDGSMRICVFRPPDERYVGTFLHEVLHFQFIHYYKDTYPTNTLTDEQFDYFKEAMTVILNLECLDIMGTPDRGYPMHQEFRNAISVFREKNRNFDNLIAFGIKNVKKYSMDN